MTLDEIYLLVSICGWVIPLLSETEKVNLVLVLYLPWYLMLKCYSFLRVVLGVFIRLSQGCQLMDP